MPTAAERKAQLEAAIAERDRQEEERRRQQQLELEELARQEEEERLAEEARAEEERRVEGERVAEEERRQREEEEDAERRRREAEERDRMEEDPKGDGDREDTPVTAWEKRVKEAAAQAAAENAVAGSSKAVEETEDGACWNCASRKLDCVRKR